MQVFFFHPNATNILYRSPVILPDPIYSCSVLVLCGKSIHWNSVNLRYTGSGSHHTWHGSTHVRAQSQNKSVEVYPVFVAVAHACPSAILDFPVHTRPPESALDTEKTPFTRWVGWCGTRVLQKLGVTACVLMGVGRPMNLCMCLERGVHGPHGGPWPCVPFRDLERGFWLPLLFIWVAWILTFGCVYFTNRCVFV